jgi:hypothetical protein
LRASQPISDSGRPGGSARLSPSISTPTSPTRRTRSIVKAYNATIDVSLTVAVTVP